MQFSCIEPIDMTLLDVTIPDQSGPGSNGNEGVLCIPQSSSITGISPSYPGQSLGRGSYPTAGVQSVFSTAPVDKAIIFQ